MLKKIILFLFLILFVRFCYSIEFYDVMNFFFDGVPKKDKVIKNMELLDYTDISTISNDIDPMINTKFPKKIIFHTPFQKKLCADCHGGKNSLFTMSIEGSELCWKCHEDFQNSSENLHVPVEEGECNECHHHHMSKHSKLLLQTVNKLCDECHDTDELLETKAHLSKDNKIIKKSCVECHNPHGSNKSALLRENYKYDK